MTISTGLATSAGWPSLIYIIRSSSYFSMILIIVGIVTFSSCRALALPGFLAIVDVFSTWGATSTSTTMVLDTPVELMIHLHALVRKQVLEQALQVRVVWLIFKAEGTAIFEVRLELLWKIFAQHVDRRCHFLLHDLLIFLLLRVRFQALPRKAAAQEVHHNEPQRL